MRGNTGANQLASVLAQMIHQGAGALDQDWLDLGTIQADGSLKTDRFLKPFPVGQFYVHPTFTRQYLRDAVTVTTAAGGGDGHTHQVTLPAIPNPDYPLVSGDRVVVAWLNDGVDPFVLMRAVV